MLAQPLRKPLLVSIDHMEDSKIDHDFYSVQIGDTIDELPALEYESMHQFCPFSNQCKIKRKYSMKSVQNLDRKET